MRLNRDLLGTIRREKGDVVDVPAEELLDLPVKAVQFGTGNFLRGFLDDFLHRANREGKFGGRVVAIGSTGSARDAALREQDGLYTLCVEGIENGEQVQQNRIISSLSRAISATDDWEGVLALARSPDIQFVFSNTTEVGIADDTTSQFEDAPPASFPAKLTRFLYERGKAFDFDAAHGVTVIPCELIENNGNRLREIVLAIAKRWSLGGCFATWIDHRVPFCNTLVDRIVPGAPKGERVQVFADKLGYEDSMLTCCEPYRLFAIEGDDALREKLTWAAVDPTGIVIAPDISPYRKRKVHLLNGGHTIFVTAALAMGCETVVEAMSQPLLADFVRRAMIDEIAPTLHVEDTVEFAEAVLDRFRNPFIKHALIDITLQATMKMRVRVVPPIRWYIEEKGVVPQALAFGFAAFLNFMQGTLQESRRARGLNVPTDGAAPKFVEYWKDFPPEPTAPVGALVKAICADVSLWGTDLTALPGFHDAVTEYLSRIRHDGMAAALEHHLTEAQGMTA